MTAVRIIVEEISHDRWCAWVSDKPAIRCEAETAYGAIYKLQAQPGNEDWNFDGMKGVEAAMRPSHLEFTIPRVKTRRMPRPFTD